MARGAGLQLGRLVRGGRFAGVLVVEVHLDAGQEFVEAIQAVFHHGRHPILQTGAAFDVVVTVDLDLHAASSF